MEWLIFGTLVTVWSVRLLEVAHALGFLDKLSQRPSGTPPRERPRPRQRQRRRARRTTGTTGNWQTDYMAHLMMGETSINDVDSEQFRRALQMLDRKKENPVAESVDWKKEGF